MKRLLGGAILGISLGGRAGAISGNAWVYVSLSYWQSDVRVFNILFLNLHRLRASTAL